jgi:hypothetical protein
LLTLFSKIRSKIRRYSRKGRDEQVRIAKELLFLVFSAPFFLRCSQWFYSYLAYQPDSHIYFNAHPEFKSLFKRFTKSNRKNAGDLPRLWSFIINCKQIIDEGIQGDFAELGVWRGNTAAVLAYYAEQSDRITLLFDTFAGFSPKDLVGVDANRGSAFENTSIAMVRKIIGPPQSCCEFVQGYFPDSADESHRNRSYAIVSLDCDLYEPMRAGLEFFYPRMVHGGIFFLHDYSSMHWAGAKLAIDEFCRETNQMLILIPDKSGSAFFRKSSATRSGTGKTSELQ